MGDNGRYVNEFYQKNKKIFQYVPTELRDIYLKQILPLANVITPNAFELRLIKIKNIF